MRIQGISGSRGVAVGNVYRYIQEEIVIPDYTVAEDKVEAEIGKFASAMAATLKQLDTIRQKALKDMGPEEAAIFEAHMQIAQDPSLSDSQLRRGSLRRWRSWGYSEFYLLFQPAYLCRLREGQRK